VNYELYELLQGLSAGTISAFASPRSYQLGREYFEDGRVVSMTWDPDEAAGKLIAKVRGTKTYRVTVYLYEGALQSRCSCPAWQFDEACKHVVSVLLAAREGLDQPSLPVVPPPVCKAVIIFHGSEMVVVLLDVFKINAFKPVLEIFKNPLTDGSSGQIYLPYDEFYEKLGDFTKRLEAEGIELQVNGKRPERINLAVSVTASAGSRHDWLSLAPSILANGIELSDQQRDEIFANADGFIEAGETITLLDSKTQAMLRLLAKMFSVANRTSTCVDRQGFVEMPRLRMLDLLYLRQQGARIVLAPEDEVILEGLAHFKAVERCAQPAGFIGSLRPYQLDGYAWLAFLYKNRFGACLADDMGLGKTIQVIALLGGIAEGVVPSRLPKQSAPHLIVVPPTLVFNWQRELALFYPKLRVMLYTKKHKIINDCDVIITTYDRVRLDIAFLKQQQFHVLVLDEAQAIKNLQTGRTAAIRQLNSIFTIAVTGTPIENHLGEYYSIVDVAVPGLLPEYLQFMRIAQTDDIASLVEKTRPFVLRRTKEVILKELPAKVETNVLLTMTPEQEKLYATTVAAVKQTIDQAYQVNTKAQANIVALAALVRLRQLCISPQLIDETYQTSSPKIDYLTEALQDVVNEGNAALVFSQFTSCLDLIEVALQKSGLGYYRIDGKTPMKERKHIINAFQENKEGKAVLLLSLKTGGVGLNLTRANYVYHVDPWWNPAVEHQASDRSHRIGQKQTVFVTRLIMYHSIEEKMMELKAKKQQLFTQVMEQAVKKTGELISRSDIDMLLT
jgi:superfamily II DNA or RNA helicase